MSRWRDPEAEKGNLPEGAPLVEYVETGEFRSYSYDDELARIRRIWAAEAAVARARPPRSASFRPRSIRRFS